MPEHFIIAGAQRCGSTYLYRLLDAHPEILMAKPLRPEPKYFLAQEGRLPVYQEYLQFYFPGHSRFKILGEKSVAYLEREDAAERIKRMLPGVKILIILRDPVMRAVSNYWFTRDFGLEKRSLEEVFDTLEDKAPGPEAGKISVSPYRYLARGRYVESIERYEKIFGRARLHIVILENFSGNAAELRKLYIFLGAATSFMPEKPGFVDNESGKRDEKISDKTLKRLISYFRESNTRLANRYGLDLSRWPQS